MNTLIQAKTLFGVLFRSTFVSGKKKDGEKSSSRISKAAGMVIFGVVVAVYLVFFTLMLTKSTVGNKEMLYRVPYLIFDIATIAILVLGAYAVLSVLYFSKDNQLLASLPISSRAVFLAKFALTYVTELLIGLVLVIPMSVTFAAVCVTSQIVLPVGFYILAFIAAFITPVVPLLVISLLSLPLMYLVSLVKRRTIANAVSIIVLIAAAMSVYMALIGSVTNMTATEGGVVAGQYDTFITGFSKLMIFDKPLVDAMFGVNVGLNLLLYFGIIIVVSVGTVMLSSVFYRKAVAVNSEGNGGTRNNKRFTSEQIKPLKPAVSLFRNEIKTLANTPMMLVNSLMGIILLPILMIYFSATNISGSETTEQGTMFMLSMSIYMTCIITASTNLVAVVGMSREGNNLYMLKSLPVSASLIVKVKLIAATTINLLTCVVAGVTFAIVDGGHSVLLALGLMAVGFTAGFGLNCLSLLSDIKNPNLKWQNATELTKNNKRVLKPTLTIIGIGLSYMVLGMVLSMTMPFKPVYCYLLYFSVCLLVNTALIVVFYKKLMDKHEDYFEQIE